MFEHPDLNLLYQTTLLNTDENTIIYHYCSLESLIAIIENKTIRLSDINTLNDFSEFHWSYSVFLEVINQEFDKYEKEFFEFIDERISQIQLRTLPLVASFSLSPDVLSQWRAYSNDGTGVSIGFSAMQMAKLSVKIGKIEYDRIKQIAYMKELIKLFFPLWKTLGSKKSKTDLENIIFVESVDFCLFKNPAFSEENEVRLIRATIVEINDGVFTIRDSSGSGVDKVTRKPQKIRYRSKGGGLVTYIDLPLSGLGDGLIKEIVLGPKSENSGPEISMLLTSNGYKGFKIVKSAATYR